MKKLFAVYLGGRAPGCNTELHDVVFVVSSSIEEAYPILVKKWFGSTTKLHVDAWAELKFIDSHEVELAPGKGATNDGDKKLYFINLGAYRKNHFQEIHESAFFVGSSGKEVKQRAKEHLCRGLNVVHTDDLFEVDDCILVDEIDGYHVRLIESKTSQELEITNGYFPIPREILEG